VMALNNSHSAGSQDGIEEVEVSDGLVEETERIKQQIFNPNVFQIPLLIINQHFPILRSTQPKLKSISDISLLIKMENGPDEEHDPVREGSSCSICHHMKSNKHSCPLFLGKKIPCPGFGRCSTCRRDLHKNEVDSEPHTKVQIKTRREFIGKQKEVEKRAQAKNSKSQCHPLAGIDDFILEGGLDSHGPSNLSNVMKYGRVLAHQMKSGVDYSEYFKISETKPKIENSASNLAEGFAQQIMKTDGKRLPPVSPVPSEKKKDFIHKSR